MNVSLSANTAFRKELARSAPIEKVSDRDLMFHLPADLAAGDYRVRLLVKRGLTKKGVEYRETVSIL